MGKALVVDCGVNMARASAELGNGSDSAPVLTVIIPVYNEAPTLQQLLERVAAAPYQKQIIVVDDGSTNGTAAVLARWCVYPGIEVLTHDVNRGKGRAIRTGLERARGQFTIIQDADLEYDPQDYMQVIEPLRLGEAQVVFGSRYSRGIADGGPQLLFRIGVSVLNGLVRVLYGVRITDEATCYKAMPTSLLRLMDLQCERFEFCPEVTAKACRLGVAIHEVPISYSARSQKAGKKIRWRDGFAAVRTLWRWRRWSKESACAPQGAVACGGNKAPAIVEVN